jgi:hypothetical protein
LLCLGQLQRAEASNIVSNGSFDLDTPSSQTAPLGWTLASAPDGSNFFVGNGLTFGAFSPPNSANFGAGASSDDVLSQTLATTAGTTYTFDFWLAHNNTDDANDFHVLWGDVHVLDLLNSSYFDYTEYTFSETATGTSTTIAFEGRENPAWYSLDDVSVTPATVVRGEVATPEPGTLFLLGTGLISVGILRRKKQ